MDYFYSAAMLRSRGALWPSFALALITPIGHYKHELNDSGGQTGPGGTGAFRSISILPVQSGLRLNVPVSPVVNWKPVSASPCPGLSTPPVTTKSRCVSLPAPSKWVIATPLIGLVLPSGFG